MPEPVISPAVEVEQTKEQLSNDIINASVSTLPLNSTISQAPVFTTSDQQVPYSTFSTSVPYFSSPPVQSSTTHAFHVMNSQYNPNNQLDSTSGVIKPFILTPHVTALPSFTSQESTIVSPTQEPVVSTVSTFQSNTQELPNHLPIYSSQNNYSQHHPVDIGGTTTVADIQSSKEISNYFTQFQIQDNSPNDSSTIPMFPVKSFPQMSPLAQPLGKLFLLLKIRINMKFKVKINYN